MLGKTRSLTFVAAQETDTGTMESGIVVQQLIHDFADELVQCITPLPTVGGKVATPEIMAALVKASVKKGFTHFQNTIQVSLSGVSSGIAVFLSVLMALFPCAVKPDLGMYAATGAISLSGQICRVGSITCKVETAAANGFKCIIVPEDNRAEIEAMPTKPNVKVEYVKNINDLMSTVIQGGY